MVILGYNGPRLEYKVDIVLNLDVQILKIFNLSIWHFSKSYEIRYLLSLLLDQFFIAFQIRFHIIFRSLAFHV